MYLLDACHYQCSKFGIDEADFRAFLVHPVVGQPPRGYLGSASRSLVSFTEHLLVQHSIEASTLATSCRKLYCEGPAQSLRARTSVHSLSLNP